LLVLMDFMRADEAVELHTHDGISISWEDLSLQAQQRSVRVGVPGRNKYVRSWDGKTGSRATFLARILKKAGFEERQATTLAQEALSAVWEALSRMEEPIASEARLFVRAGDAKRLNPDWWRAHLVEPGSPIFRCDICGRLQTISIRATCPRFRCPGTLVTQLARAEDNRAYHYRVLYEEDLPASLRVEEHTAIPKYGFPVDVVELDPQRTKGSGSRETLEVSLQRDLAIAVAEFAPTSKVVANKKLWTSYGLKRVPEREWDRRLYKRCDRHHMFVSWGQDEAEPATRCCDRMAGPKDGYIDPQFGFVTNRQKPEDPKARPTRVFTTRPYFGQTRCGLGMRRAAGFP